METMRLRTMQQPSMVKVLHDSLLNSLNRPPRGADRIAERSDLPMALQRLAISISKGGGSWAAWHTRDRIQFCTAEMALDQSRDRGQAVLNVTTYDERGTVRKWEVWAQTANGAWQSHSV